MLKDFNKLSLLKKLLNISRSNTKEFNYTYPFKTSVVSYMQNPKQEVKNNLTTKLEAIEHNS